MSVQTFQQQDVFIARKADRTQSDLSQEIKATDAEQITEAASDEQPEARVENNVMSKVNVHHHLLQINPDAKAITVLFLLQSLLWLHESRDLYTDQLK